MSVSLYGIYKNPIRFDTPASILSFGEAPAGGVTYINRAAAATIAMGDYLTWLVLAANSSDIVNTTQTVVMTITGVGVGRYYFKCQLIWQGGSVTTGVDVSVNHTGTLTQYVAEHRFSGTGNAAATGAASEISNNTSGNIYESQGIRTINTVIGGGSNANDTANSDMISIIEGFFVVSASGDLQIKMACETASQTVRAMQGSHLELRKLS